MSNFKNFLKLVVASFPLMIMVLIELWAGANVTYSIYSVVGTIGSAALFVYTMLYGFKVNDKLREKIEKEGIYHITHKSVLPKIRMGNSGDMFQLNDIEKSKKGVGKLIWYVERMTSKYKPSIYFFYGRPSYKVLLHIVIKANLGHIFKVFGKSTPEDYVVLYFKPTKEDLEHLYFRNYERVFGVTVVTYMKESFIGKGEVIPLVDFLKK